MSNKVKMLITRIVILILIATSIVLGGFLVKNHRELTLAENKIEDVNNTNVAYQEIIKELAATGGKSDKLETVTLTVIELDNSTTTFDVYLILNISIYDFLLLNGYSKNDFDSWDGANFYFKNSLTDVNELKDNSDYYDTDGVYTSLVVGLQDIIIDQNLTVVRSGY